MSDHNSSSSQIKNYILQLNQLYAGGNFLDENFSAKLSIVNEATAFIPPADGVHSVAEILWHCTYWRTVNLNRFQGNNRYREETIDEMDWIKLDELKKKGWSVLRAEFDQSQAALTELLVDKTDNYLENEYEAGKTFGYLIDGTIQHDAYHLGQIGLVIKCLRLKKVL